MYVYVKKKVNYKFKILDKGCIKFFLIIILQVYFWII